ncbi:hypothetical protein C8J57DRAFT_1636804, partial [Mycena rebaudengoi]
NLHARQRRTPTPAPPHREATPTYSPRRDPTPDSPTSSLMSLESEGDDNTSNASSTSMAKRLKSSAIPRPSGANISSVKSLFKDLYPDLIEVEQEAEYTAFRDCLDALFKYLRPTLVLSHQSKADLDKVYTKMTETFMWLPEYENHWPVAVAVHGFSVQTELYKATSSPLPSTLTEGRSLGRLRVADSGFRVAGSGSKGFGRGDKENGPLKTLPLEVPPERAPELPLLLFMCHAVLHFHADPPWPRIHDFIVRLHHGKKMSRFRIFLKRGKTLVPNAVANIIAGDVVIIAFARMTKFQSVTCTQLPTELVVQRVRAFPGSP